MNIGFTMIIKRLTLSIFLFLQLAFVFANKSFYSANGYFYFEFADDFSECRYLVMENGSDYSEKIKVSIAEMNGLCIWKIENTKYVCLQSENFFVLMNDDKNHTFIKDYDEYWLNEKEVVPSYEASSQMEIAYKTYDAYNLLYLNFNPWISDSESCGIGEFIIINSDKEFGSIRIVNGYVNLNDPVCFEEYGRVKTLKIFNKEDVLIQTINVKDSSNIQSYKLPEKTKHIRIEISDVYQGCLR